MNLAPLPPPVVARPPRLDDQLPPTKPPRTLGFGGCCFRAVSEIRVPCEQVPGWTVAARVAGYDTSPAIAKVVESACAARAGAMGGGAECTEATLTMLKASRHRCEGEVYFESPESSSRIA